MAKKRAKRVQLTEEQKARQKQLANETRKARVAGRMCVSCGGALETDDIRDCRKCKDKRNATIRNNRKKKKASMICSHCNKNAIEGQAMCSDCATKNSERHRGKYTSHRITAIKNYGGKCQCCNCEEIEDLVVKQDGIAKNYSATWIKNIATSENREDIRVLCRSCMFTMIRNGGVCSHKEKGEEE